MTHTNTNTNDKAAGALITNGLHTDTNVVNFRTDGAIQQAPDGNAIAGQDVALTTTAAERRVGTQQSSEYHRLHDAVRAVTKNSTKVRFIHMNVNKLINKMVGIAAKQRGKVPGPTQALLTVAQTIAANAMQGATDHHHGYQLAQQALESFTATIPGPEASHAI